MSVRKLGVVVFATSVAIVLGYTDFELRAQSTTYYCQTTTDTGCPSTRDIRGECCRNAKAKVNVYWCLKDPGPDCASNLTASCQGDLYNASCNSPPDKPGNQLGTCTYSVRTCK
jgi:hypothetical protein